MSDLSPEERIGELVGALRPVRRIPPLRVVAAFAALPWLIALAVAWGVVGSARPHALSDPFWTSPAQLAILAGLLLVAVGATSAALASAVPGREATMRRGLVGAAIGLGIATLCALAKSAELPATIDAAWWRGSIDCLVHGIAFGFASALVACRFVGEAAMRRPLASAALAIAGGVGLGAVAIHLACSRGDGLHLLVSHALSPLVAAALLALPIAAGLRRFGARRNAA